MCICHVSMGSRSENLLRPGKQVKDDCLLEWPPLQPAPLSCIFWLHALSSTLIAGHLLCLQYYFHTLEQECSKSNSTDALLTAAGSYYQILTAPLGYNLSFLIKPSTSLTGAC
jgi:hypothetical protein